MANLEMSFWRGKRVLITGNTGFKGSWLTLLLNEQGAKLYGISKKISVKEKKSLNILCRGAAMRYFLTRLYDYTNTPKTALIKIKDPREYYQKLVIHNNLRNYKDYLN